MYILIDTTNNESYIYSERPSKFQPSLFNSQINTPIIIMIVLFSIVYFLLLFPLFLLLKFLDKNIQMLQNKILIYYYISNVFFLAMIMLLIMSTIFLKYMYKIPYLSFILLFFAIIGIIFLIIGFIFTTKYGDNSTLLKLEIFSVLMIALTCFLGFLFMHFAQNTVINNTNNNNNDIPTQMMNYYNTYINNAQKNITKELNDLLKTAQEQYQTYQIQYNNLNSYQLASDIAINTQTQYNILTEQLKNLLISYNNQNNILDNTKRNTIYDDILLGKSLSNYTIPQLHDTLTNILLSNTNSLTNIASSISAINYIPIDSNININKSLVNNNLYLNELQNTSNIIPISNSISISNSLMPNMFNIPVLLTNFLSINNLTQKVSFTHNTGSFVINGYNLSNTLSNVTGCGINFQLWDLSQAFLYIIKYQNEIIILLYINNNLHCVIFEQYLYVFSSLSTSQLSYLNTKSNLIRYNSIEQLLTQYSINNTQTFNLTNSNSEYELPITLNFSQITGKIQNLPKYHLSSSTYTSNLNVIQNILSSTNTIVYKNNITLDNIQFLLSLPISGNTNAESTILISKTKDINITMSLANNNSTILRRNINITTDFYDKKISNITFSNLTPAQNYNISV